MKAKKFILILPLISSFFYLLFCFLPIWMRVELIGFDFEIRYESILGYAVTPNGFRLALFTIFFMPIGLSIIIGALYTTSLTTKVRKGKLEYLKAEKRWVKLGHYLLIPGSIFYFIFLTLRWLNKEFQLLNFSFFSGLVLVIFYVLYTIFIINRSTKEKTGNLIVTFLWLILGVIHSMLVVMYLNDPVAGTDFTFTYISIYYFIGSFLLLLCNYLSKKFNLIDIIAPFAEKKRFHNLSKFGWIVITFSLLGYLINIFITTSSSWVYFALLGPSILIIGIILWLIGKIIIIFVG